MPNFAPDFTPRYIEEYTAGGLTHHLTLRPSRGLSTSTGATQMQSLAHDIFAALASLLPDNFVRVGSVYIPEDSSISLNAGVPAAVVGAVDHTQLSVTDKISHLTFSGKGQHGGRWHIKIFCVSFTADVVPSVAESDYVFHAGEVAAIDNAVAAIAASSNVRAIDNTVLAVRSDVTYKQDEKSGYEITVTAYPDSAGNTDYHNDKLPATPAYTGS